MNNNDVYKLAQVHYHWGRNESEGSEHTLNGIQCPLEVQFVHINTNVPDTDPDRLLVIGVLYQAVNYEDAPQTNWLKSVALKAKNIAFKELQGEVDPYIEQNKVQNLYKTLTTGLEGGFWSYKGGLTTPSKKKTNFKFPI